VVGFLSGCPKAGLNIPQTFSVGQLRECHAEKLIPTGEALDFVIA